MTRRRTSVWLALEGGISTKVQAVYYGIWAVHSHGDYNNDWRVTHAPSGRAISRELTEATATFLALILATRVPAFSFIDDGVTRPPRGDEWWDWARILEATVGEVEGA